MSVPSSAAGFIRGRGLGINCIPRGIADIARAGYGRRWQEPGHVPGRFGRCAERLSLPPCGASGRAGRIVRREWFDGRFTLNGLAALVYLRAGRGGPAVSCASYRAGSVGPGKSPPIRSPSCSQWGFLRG